ncbi:MAG: TGS domain-containing protein, partial [Acidimicrobiales bacterium]
MAIDVTLPDGSSRSLEEGATAGDLAAAIGRGLAKAAVVAEINGEERELTTPLHDGDAVAIVTDTTDEGRYVIRHSTAHVLAQAVLDLFPGATFGIGPPVEDGFYYDFELPDGATFGADDLARIEARMRDLAAEDQRVEREELSIDDGLALFADQPYKQEIIRRVGGAGDAAEGVGDTALSVYRNLRADGGVAYVDLCQGPHVPSTAKLGPFRLTKV